MILGQRLVERRHGVGQGEDLGCGEHRPLGGLLPVGAAHLARVGRQDAVLDGRVVGVAVGIAAPVVIAVSLTPDSSRSLRQARTRAGLSSTRSTAPSVGST